MGASQPAFMLELWEGPTYYMRFSLRLVDEVACVRIILIEESEKSLLKRKALLSLNSLPTEQRIPISILHISKVINQRKHMV